MPCPVLPFVVLAASLFLALPALGEPIDTIEPTATGMRPLNLSLPRAAAVQPDGMSAADVSLPRKLRQAPATATVIVGESAGPKHDRRRFGEHAVPPYGTGYEARRYGAGGRRPRRGRCGRAASYAAADCRRAISR